MLVTLLRGVQRGVFAVLSHVSRGATVVAGDVAILLIDASDTTTHATSSSSTTHATSSTSSSSGGHGPQAGGVELWVEAPAERCHLLEAVVCHSCRCCCRRRLPAEHVLRVGVRVGVPVGVGVAVRVRVSVSVGVRMPVSGVRVQEGGSGRGAGGVGGGGGAWGRRRGEEGKLGGRGRVAVGVSAALRPHWRPLAEVAAGAEGGQVREQVRRHLRKHLLGQGNDITHHTT